MLLSCPLLGQGPLGSTGILDRTPSPSLRQIANPHPKPTHASPQPEPDVKAGGTATGHFTARPSPAHLAGAGPARGLLCHTGALPGALPPVTWQGLSLHLREAGRGSAVLSRESRSSPLL